MILRDLINDVLINDIRTAVAETLSESIIDYFVDRVSALKKQDPSDVFTDRDPVDTEDLARVVTALKVLSNKDHRAALTQDDVGFSPTKASQLFKFLDSIKRDGKQDRDVEEALNALKSLAPSIYRRELEALEKLKSRDPEEKKEAMKNLGDLAERVNNMFKLLKQRVQQPGKPVQDQPLE